jgi:uncharacterized protein
MITLIPLEDNFTIYQVPKYSDIQSHIFESGFFSITSTGDEISVVTNSILKSDNLKASEGWKGFRVEGILDFSLVGIINSITQLLKDNKISVLVISTFNTDYVFVRRESFDHAIEVFKSSDSITVKVNQTV